MAPPEVKPVESTPLVPEGELAKKSTICIKMKQNAEIIFAVIFLMFCQSGMLIINKGVMIVWDLPITITIIQMAFASVVLLSLSKTLLGEKGIVTLRIGKNDDGSLKWNDVRRWSLAVPWLFALMLATSMLALHYSSTGAVVVTRNIAPIITLTIEALAKEKVAVDVWTVAALVYTLIGVALYMMNDIEFSGIGFICIIANMGAGVMERIVQRRLIAVEPVDLSKMVLVLINNSVAIPLVAILLWPTKEYEDWHTLKASDPDGPDNGFAYFLLVLSCFVGVAIGWAGVNAQFYLTATSFMVVGNVNKFVVIAVGMLAMNESASWQAILGCVIAVSGGFLYAIARTKLQDKLNKKKKEEEAAAGPKSAA